MKRLLAVIFAAALALSSCSLVKQTVQLEAMDTFMKFEYYGSEELGEKLSQSVKSLDKELSAVDENGRIYKLNQKGSGKLSYDAEKLLKESLALCESTDGELDVTVLPVVKEWGFINQEYRVPASTEIKKALKKVDYRKISLRNGSVKLNGCQLDLGAVAKGYAADKSVKLLSENGVETALLNLGGTIAAVGSKPDGTLWKVGVADPANPSDYVGFVSCKDKVVATSGGYERYFEQYGKRYIHIIDPKTGLPVDNGVASVTIISDSGVLGDALSTALFVMGLKKAQSYHRERGGFGFVILTEDKKAYVSRDICADFTLSDKDYELKILD